MPGPKLSDCPDDHPCFDNVGPYATGDEDPEEQTANGDDEEMPDSRYFRAIQAVRRR